MISIVMVCTGNTCRSPMAEAMLRVRLAERGVEGAEVRSAGLHAFEGAPISGGAQAELEKRGIPFAPAGAVPLMRSHTEGALILCMTGAQLRELKRRFPAARATTLNLAAGLSGDIADPFGGRGAAYRRAAEQIERAVMRLADRIANNDTIEEGCEGHGL